MQSPGHLGLALLFAAPAWLVFGQLKAGAAFSALAATTAMFPDIDLVAMRVLFIEHHGISHSLVFLIPAALVLGGVVTAGYLAIRDRTGRPTKSSRSVTALYAFATLALFTGMLAHLAGDVLTSPDVAPPIKPLMPITDSALYLDAAFVKSNLWNLGTLALGITVQTAFGIRGWLAR